MKIYVSHSTNFDYINDLYTPLKGMFPLSSLLLPHEHENSSILTKDILINKECDFILAEVSYPSTGQGIELGWANISDIPVICIHKNNAKISSSLKYITSDFLTYTNIVDIKDKLLHKLQI